MRAVDTVSRADGGLRAGLPLLPALSTQYRCLPSVSVQSAWECQTALGARLLTLGPGPPGHPGNVDAPNLQPYARKAMPQSCSTPEDREGQAVRTCYPQAQASQKPRSALAASSGTTVSQGTRRVATLTRALLARDFLMGADKEGDGGPRLQDLQAQYGVKGLPPVTASPTRQVELEAVALEPYNQTVWGNVAAVSPTRTDCDGPWRRLRKTRPHGPSGALIPPACTMPAGTARPPYTQRWRLEPCCAENAVRGVHHRPALHLNALQTRLSLRLLACHVVDNCRHDLGAASQQKTPELIHRECVDGVQGRGQWRGHLIEVRIYGFAHEAAAAAILTNLDTKRAHAGVDPRIPGLGNRRLRCTFH